MIVVIGAVEARGVDGDGAPPGPTGPTWGTALAAVGAGARVEVVTRLGDDAAGDALLLAFAAAQVGHVATLRDAAHATPFVQPADESVDPDTADGLDASDEHRGDAAPGVSPSGGGRPTLEAADVALALRYLSDYRVIVVVHPAEDGIVREVIGAADWASAHLVVVARPGEQAPDGLPEGSVLLAIDPDAEAVASLVGRYAAAVDRGDDPATAFRATLGAAG